MTLNHWLQNFVIKPLEPRFEPFNRNCDGTRRELFFPLSHCWIFILLSVICVHFFDIHHWHCSLFSILRHVVIYLLYYKQVLNVDTDKYLQHNFKGLSYWDVLPTHICLTSYREYTILECCAFLPNEPWEWQWSNRDVSVLRFGQ